MTDMHECFTYHIDPLHEQMPAGEYFRGDVYKATWITDSIKEGQLLDKSEYLHTTYGENDRKSNKKLSLPSKCPYTLTEALKIYQLS